MNTAIDDGAAASPTKAPYESFALRLRKIREERGLSQRELAKRIKKHNSEISDYENGTMPSFWNLCELARALNVSLDWLCGLTDERRPLKSAAAPNLDREPTRCNT
jgi:transcriptional regulator with XRE-family HTH domain